MALPAYSGKRTASRMDLVALEKVDHCWKIVFWEAKFVTNPSARCRGDAYPKVGGQLAQYTWWLGHVDHAGRFGHRDLVAAAYQNACRLLVKMAKRINPKIKELGEGITAAAASDVPLLLVDHNPRLLIDDHTQNIAFNQNGHLKKLRDKPWSLQVQMVKGLHDWTLDVHL